VGESLLEFSEETPTSYRWVVLASYSTIALVSQILWLSFAPVTTIVAQVLNISETYVGMLSMSWPLIFIPASIPAGAIIDKYGFRAGILIGSFFMSIGAVLRILTLDNYFLLFTAQAIAGIGQPFIFNSITKLSVEWFPVRERALATGVGVMGQYIGMITAMVFTPTLVPFPEKGLLVNALSLYAALTVIGSLLFFIVGKERKTVMHNSLEAKASISLHEIALFLKTRDLMILSGVFFIGVGVFTALLTWLEPMLVLRGLEVAEAGLIGGVMLTGGIIGSILIPGISDRMRRRKPFIVLDLAVATVMFILLASQEDFTIIGLSSFVLGFFMMSALPIGLELSAEIVGPKLAGSVSSVLWLFSQIGAVAYIPLLDAVKGATQHLYPSNPYFASMNAIVVSTSSALVLSLMLKETPSQR
jgi:MFS family permease